ncbi:glutathione S-transferase [Coprinopsis cinerea okayama7|uniref:glutathione transferase n=1 Tax=Coprinopsis cinerea (strain Okayama-7 / 130 / ATCC MYA-4618 / FGSC 9003) TaxID=240176 RepID=A8P3K1_COPC7|nr:glutathione S-transferase [Coprinopsis cinerea okayama7\|eukprot:XP_001838561.2 glutathione S-transferase [Coprinopsis cinerea okayama7\
MSKLSQSSCMRRTYHLSSTSSTTARARTRRLSTWRSNPLDKFHTLKMTVLGSTRAEQLHDLKKKALFEQAASIEVNNFNAYASPAVFEKLFKPYLNLTPDPAVYEKLFSQLEAKLDVYEKILSKQRYLAGDELTLADLFHLPYGVLLPQAGCNWTENRPNVARWFKELTERESWKAVKDGVKPIAA